MNKAAILHLSEITKGMQRHVVLDYTLSLKTV